MTILLRPAELLYRGVNRARRALYRVGLLPSTRLPRPVISVGNIGVGGAGKTPTVIALARFLESQGLRVAVLSRGYGRGDVSYSGIVTSNDPVKYGDEPILIHDRINGDVIVGKNRSVNALEYLRDNECDVFILDDGFQHLQLQRDFDLVIDAPSRFLREGRAALRHADTVIPRRLRLAVPEHLRGQHVFAFCALANNEQFFDALRAEGLQLTGARAFRDHHRYSSADLDAIRRDAAGAPIVTTEKDAVKISDSSIIPIRAEMQIEQDVLDQALRVARGERRKKHRKPPFLQTLEYAAYRAVARVVTSRADASIARWGARIGTLSRFVLRGRDRLAMRNLHLAFPSKSKGEVRDILDRCWRHFGHELLQYLQLQNATLEQLTSRFDFVNSHLVEEAMARGKGTLLISAHWGSWEIAGLAMMSRLPNLHMVARPLDNELLERDLQRLREKTGAVVMDRRRAARPLMRALSENAAIVLLPDQAVQPREGVLVPFLGRPAWTTPAPAKMALRADATIVFAFCIGDGPRHRIEFQEAIRADLLVDDERDPVNLTKRINDVISARITARPELWLWMHDRWKGTGESEVLHGV